MIDEKANVHSDTDYYLRDSGSSVSKSATQESSTEKQQQHESGIDIELACESSTAEPSDSSEVNIVKTDSGYLIKAKGQKIKYIHVNDAVSILEKTASKMASNLDSSDYNKSAASHNTYDSSGEKKTEAKAAGSSITEAHIPWPELAGLGFMMFLIWYAWKQRDYIKSRFKH